MHKASILKTVGAVGVLAALSCTGDELQGTLCNRGDNIFCRCRGGAAGTKTCLEDGETFGPCESASGTCEEMAQGTEGTGGGGTTPPPVAGELLAACTTDADCSAGTTCPMGYCTKPCQSYEECTPGDCVMFQGVAQCVPYCSTEHDCTQYGDDSHCSFTDAAMPPFDVVVCANWGDELQLPPDGYPLDQGGSCPDDSMCNLGWEGTERVCQDGGCTSGCHQSSDCWEVTSECSSSSLEVLGICLDPGSVLGDGCPGEPVSLALPLGQDWVGLMGDTSTLPPPAEMRGEADCAGSNNDDVTEEHIYAVTPQDSGMLMIAVDPDVDFDPSIYIRGGSCDAGQQIQCEDSTLEGQDELLEISVTANETVYVVVDGWDTSTGAFIIEFLLY